MQLTSITHVTPSPRTFAMRMARLDRPAIAAAIAFAGWLVFVVARLAGWADGKLSLFIAAGTKYSHPARMFPKVAHVRGTGYDGQFYYRFAFDPFDWQRTAYGITIDHPYRYTRIGYSVIVWVLSAGGHGRLLPLVLVLVNLLSVAAMAWLGGLFARESGRHALWGLLFAAYFGLVVSVGRDTSEPLADACLLGGLLAYRHRKFVLAALLIGYAVFTNEPVLVLPVVLALTRLWQLFLGRVRPGRADLAWAAPGFVYVLLQGIQHVVVRGPAGGAADVSANLTWPFTALGAGLDRDAHRMSLTHLGTYDYNLIEFIALMAFVVAGFLVLRSTTAPVHERFAFIGFFVVEVVSASSQFWYSVFGEGRTFIDAYVMAVVLLLATPAGSVTAGS
ncbi:MAG TPA: hypothetical protein VHT26_23935, partial [Trebonia sp.]|nr:hypothetical protein [Trebonia sp.]